MASNGHVKQSKQLQATLKSIEIEQYMLHDSHRRMARYITGMMSTIVAILYFLIGVNLLVVFESGDSQLFGILAAGAYAFGALLLFAVQNRTMWILGAVLQVLTIYTYLSFAPQRIPEFEVWGIVLGVMQVLILLGLGYLIVRAPHPFE